MITIELLALEDNKLVSKTVAISQTSEFSLETLNEPVQLPIETIGQNVGFFLCNPNFTNCIQLTPEEYNLNSNIININSNVLRRFSFIPGTKLIVTVPNPFTFDIANARNNTYYYSVLIKALGEVATNVSIKPIVRVDWMKKYVDCKLINEVGEEVDSLSLNVLDESGVALLLKLTISEELLEKVEPGDYPLIDIQLEYY